MPGVPKVSSRRPELVTRKYEYLRKNGIRSKLYDLPTGRVVHTGMMSLRVYKDDAAKAEELLRTMPE
jgi:hypothetical protein